ncbi:MAG: polysaccharide deacetylase family protein [Desulfobulbaceae bacterium]|jgi:peptidoglycan/xylan/chitin deacetylase (PgdA/CDA1 family)|nr:polysaccharide deacetylase family protein [Desulfobulbaceae bacterium]
MYTSRYLAKILCHGALGITGLYRRAHKRLAGRLVLLTYHSFADKSTDALNGAQPIRLFRQQMDFLRRNYQIVSLEEGWQRLKAGDPAWPPFAAVTIDDGFADNYQFAFPVLQEFAIPATIFLATDFIDTGRMPWPTRLGMIMDAALLPRMEFPFAAPIATRQEKIAAFIRLKNSLAVLPPLERFIHLDELAARLHVKREAAFAPLSWRQIREMRDAGIHFGSHTEFHSILPNIDAATRKQEALVSKKRLEEELKAECRLLAYPNGDYDKMTCETVAACGYALAVSQENGANGAATPPLALHRIEIPHHDPFASFAGRVSLGLPLKSHVGAI